MYNQILEKGPYSVLRLKKQIADLKELVQNKTHENEELTKNGNPGRVKELFDELQFFDKENQKMRGITERVIQIARNNGLEAQMLQDKEIKDFIDFNHQMFDGPQPSKLSN